MIPQSYIMVEQALLGGDCNLRWLTTIQEEEGNIMLDPTPLSNPTLNPKHIIWSDICGSWIVEWKYWWKKSNKISPIYWRNVGEGNGNPLQYDCLENSMDGGAW